MAEKQQFRRRKPQKDKAIRLAGRKVALDEKRRKSAMMRADEFVAGLGIGRNVAYAALQAGEVEGAIKFGKTWLIPRRTFEKMTGGASAVATTAI